jgi:hypothetical protein
VRDVRGEVQSLPIARDDEDVGVAARLADERWRLDRQLAESPLPRSDGIGHGGSMTKEQLQKKLARASQVRVLLTLSAFVANIYLLQFVPARIQAVTFAVTFFGVPLMACWLVTATLCRRMVSCPFCGGSLWNMGNGAFKVRRVRIRPHVNTCPNCGTELF